MILPFSTKFPNGNKTYFIEKIWECLISKGIKTAKEWRLYQQAYKAKFGCVPDYPKYDIKPKLHTFRHDLNNWWSDGSKIHPVINDISENYFQFTPILECVSTQKIEIKWEKDKAYVIIDDKKIKYNIIEQLACNEGFDSVREFFECFNEDFKSKIIHWTDLKY